jgi:hypothetical protein
MPLRFTDGVTTVDLQTAPWLGVTYYPQAGGLDETEVTESAVCVLEGTATAIRAAVNGLQGLLAAAHRRQRRVDARVWVEFRPLTSDSWFRAEVFDGTVVWSSNPAKRLLGAAANTVEVAVSFRRANGWDGPETEVELSTSSQGAATGGRSIYNHDDGGTGHDNWVQIAAGQVVGEVPGPCRVQLTNTTGASRTFRKMAVAVNALSDPANFVHILEAESRTSGGTVEADATASGGNVVDLAHGSTTTTTLVWALSAAQMGRSRGRLFRLLVRMVGMIGTWTVTPEVRAADGGTVLWRGDVVTLPDLYGGMIDLGVLPLPPGGYSASYGGATLALAFTGSGLAEVDFLQLTALDGYRVLRAAVACANGDALVDDAGEGQAYLLSGGLVSGYVVGAGAPLLLYPGVVQRLMVLAEDGGSPDPMRIDNAWSVRVWHRARRLVV